MENCRLSTSDAQMLSSSGVLASFSKLQNLDIISTCAVPAIGNLSLGACTSLLEFNCSGSQIGPLDVSGCPRLQRLDCRWNRIAILNVAASPGIKVIDSSGNPLTDLILPEDAELEKLVLGDSDNPIMVVGGRSILHLDCHIYTFESLPREIIPWYRTLLLDGLLFGTLSGFRDLKQLVCCIEPGAELDFTGCNNVDATLYLTDKGSVSLLGGSSVSKLSLIGLQSPFNFTDFTALRELYYDTACMYPSKGTEILDLSSCEMLQEVRLIDSASDSRSFALRLHGCLSLETLQCDSFAALSKMDLTACAALKVLKCAGSGLKPRPV